MSTIPPISQPAISVLPPSRTDICNPSLGTWRYVVCRGSDADELSFTVDVSIAASCNEQGMPFTA